MDRKYNCERTHTGKYCFGKTPMETFLDSIPWRKIKMLDKLARLKVIPGDGSLKSVRPEITQTNPVR